MLRSMPPEKRRRTSRIARHEEAPDYIRPAREDFGMKTTFLLMAQDDGLAIIPIDLVVRDYFRHLTVDKFLRKALAGELDLPVVRMERSQKSAKGMRQDHYTTISNIPALASRSSALTRSFSERLRILSWGERLNRI